MATVKINPDSEEGKKRRCRILVHTLRAHADPDRASPSMLAKRCDISRQYLHRFILAGRVPLHIAKRMNKAFGHELAPIDQLCWPKIKIV